MSTVSWAASTERMCSSWMHVAALHFETPPVLTGQDRSNWRMYDVKSCLKNTYEKQRCLEFPRTWVMLDIETALWWVKKNHIGDFGLDIITSLYLSMKKMYNWYTKPERTGSENQDLTDGHLIWTRYPPACPASYHLHMDLCAYLCQCPSVWADMYNVNF